MCLGKCLPDSEIFLLLAAEEAFCCACAKRILIGAFGAIVKFSARFCGLSTGRSTLFQSTFWRGMKENDKYTNISNSVDTRGVCWPLWWGYFNDQSTNKTRKKPENLKFEIWFTGNQDVQMRQETLKVSLKMLMFYLKKITKLYVKTIVRYLIRWKKLI